MSALAVSSTLLLLFCAQDAQALGRRLRQSVGATKPVSATLADLVNDPTGRGHLLVRRLFVPRHIRLRHVCLCNTF